ncbi:hypothetical protein D9758_017134 [Tetrapyrgos nigripes]|uniref:Uncharacterized protein n=1 Tax=Tetrapyrgos nigripes TaxID=182062 RepID=A0A8H5BI14_9AGAR|nr:hypothetical protein D9758_017134 [Tetrapyrgos nigripes]
MPPKSRIKQYTCPDCAAKYETQRGYKKHVGVCKRRRANDDRVFAAAAEPPHSRARVAGPSTLASQEIVVEELMDSDSDDGTVEDETSGDKLGIVDEMEVDVVVERMMPQGRRTHKTWKL